MTSLAFLSDRLQLGREGVFKHVAVLVTARLEEAGEDLVLHGVLPLLPLVGRHLADVVVGRLVALARRASRDRDDIEVNEGKLVRELQVNRGLGPRRACQPLAECRAAPRACCRREADARKEGRDSSYRR
jgi:hypothetical protein